MRRQICDSHSLAFLAKSGLLEAVLFDMDGVILNSMSLHDDAWRQALLEQGVEISSEEILLREGEKGTQTARDLLQKKNRNPTAEQIEGLIQRKRQLLKKNIRIDLFPMAEECVDFFHRKGYRLGLVTGSFRHEVELLLPPPVLDRFHVVVTADDVERGKPHPESYLRAVSKLGVRPQAALVVENAPYGVRSAKAAGMACIALTTSLSREYLKEADWIVPDLEALMSVFNGSE